MNYGERINAVDSGLARAMEFSLFPERRENDWTLIEAFRKELLDTAAPRGSMEAQRFCAMADGLGAKGKLLLALKGVVADPSRRLSPDPTGDLVYIVPWVNGPNGFNRPFGLDTKYGHLVFVFHQKGQLYDLFFKSSAETLKPGFTLKNAAVLVPRKERLGPELVANMPSTQSFQIIIEGTDEFTRYLKELADDTIWQN